MTTLFCRGLDWLEFTTTKWFSPTRIVNADQLSGSVKIS